MPTLAEELAVQPPRVNAKEKCGFITRVEETVTDEADRKAVSAAVANPRWSARALCDVLSRYGVDISFTAVAAHRRGACPCYNKAAPNG